MTHNIIKTENYLLVVDDSEIKAVDWFINLISKELLKCFKNSAVKSLGGKTINMTEKWLNNNDCKKIIAHLPLNNSPVLESVDLLPPIEDNIEQWAWDNPCLSRSDVYHLFEEVFKEKVFEGYYKISASKQVHQFNEKVRKLAKEKAEVVKEKYKYTEEDMVSFADWYHKTQGFPESNIKYWGKDLFEVWKSLQQPKIPVAFECEVERIYPNPQTISKEYDFDDILIERKTTTNLQGQTVLVGKYIY